MAIAVTQERSDVYTIQLFEPELTWVRDISKSFGMTKSSIVSASFGHGIEHYKSVDEQLTMNGKKVDEEGA